MKVFIRQNVSIELGYEVVSIDELGNEIVQPIVKKVTDNKGDWYILPENPSNRKCISGNKIKDGLELVYKESKVLGPRTESAPRKGLEEYLEGEDKELYLKLVEKAKTNRDAAKKPMTEREKLEARIAKYMAQLENLKGGN